MGERSTMFCALAAAFSASFFSEISSQLTTYPSTLPLTSKTLSILRLSIRGPISISELIGKFLGLLKIAL